MERVYDPRTGRPLVGGHDDIEGLTAEELEAEVTIAAAQPRRAQRHDALLLELARRAQPSGPQLVTDNS